MEQKAAHTPAPWLIEWNAAQGGEGHYIKDSQDTGELSRIAAVLFHDDADGETRANARLIAAAPDLLAALVTAESLLADICVYGEPPELANIRAAIAKASNHAEAVRAFRRAQKESANV